MGHPHEMLCKRFLNSAGILGKHFMGTPTLHKCDSCYHIFVTNVKAETRGAGSDGRWADVLSKQVEENRSAR
jgi:hypothetical protein